MTFFSFVERPLVMSLVKSCYGGIRLCSLIPLVFPIAVILLIQRNDLHLYKVKSSGGGSYVKILLDKK